MGRPIFNADGNGDVVDWEVILIDWADSGWYPTWVQAVAVWQRLQICIEEEFLEEKQDQFKELVLNDFEQSFSKHIELFKILELRTGYSIL